MADTATVVIGFSGAATIRQADEIAGTLRQALATSSRIEVDCSGVDEVDISFIQLLISARKSAEKDGKNLYLAAPASGVLLEALILCGAHDGPRARFWFEGGHA